MTLKGAARNLAVRALRLLATNTTAAAVESKSDHAAKKDYSNEIRRQKEKRTYSAFLSMALSTGGKVLDEIMTIAFGTILFGTRGNSSTTVTGRLERCQGQSGAKRRVAPPLCQGSRSCQA